VRRIVLEEGALAREEAGLRPYRTLKRQPEHRREGIFVAEGPTVVERLLASGLGVVSVLATERWLERLGALLDGITVYVATDEIVERITGFAYHQGVMAVGRMPPEPDLADVIGRAGPRAALVALDGLGSSENVGVLVRAASALGAAAVVAGGTSASPFLRRAVRASMGGAFFVPVAHERDLAAALRRLEAARGVRAVAAVARGGTPLPAYRFAPRSCIVLGHEFEGVSPEVLAACADRVTIPMTSDLDSLNVATAAAVLLFEAARQAAGRP
jgi:tRNA G18 (ribose-2'-O)-methylase SpoU